MNIGYIRVSTKEQNIERQLEIMKKMGIEERFIFRDAASGKNFERPGFIAMKQSLREGDILYLDSLDRLGRNYDGIIKEWKDIRKQGVHIVVLDSQDIFNSKKFEKMGDIGKLLEDQMLSIFSYIADSFRKEMLRKQKAGIEIAKRNGKYKGRAKIKISKDVFDKYYPLWLQGTLSSKDFMSKLNLKPNTFYRRIKEYEKRES